MKYLRGRLARQIIFIYAGLALFILIFAAGSIIAVDYVRQAAVVQARQHQEKALLSARIRSEALVLTNDIQLYIVTSGTKDKEIQDLNQQITVLEELLQQASTSIDTDKVDESFALGDIRQYLISFNTQAKYVLITYNLEGSYGPETQKQMEILIHNYQPALFDSLENFAEFERNVTDISFKQAEQSINNIRMGLILLSSITIISAIGMSLQMVKRFALPLTQLAEGIKHMQENITTTRISIATNDEMGELASALNNMANEVAGSRNQLEQYAANLEAQVEERTRELKRLATIDPLTNIYNRRQFLILTERLCSEAKRFNQPVSIIMFDADHFKRINDTYGHAMGDEVLKRIVQGICTQIREVDIFGRFGGEEFVLALPHTPLNSGIQVAERIADAIREIQFGSKGKEFQITVSIGITERNSASEETLAQLLRKADKALYKAKELGRNTICSYDPEWDKQETL